MAEQETDRTQTEEDGVVGEPVEERHDNTDAAMAHLSEQLEQAERRATEAGEALGQRDAEVASLRQRLSEAVGRYRDLALRQAPELPVELVAGESVDEVDASLQAALELVARIRAKMEAEVAAKVAAEWVPGGSSRRAEADVSALSPFEKIARGLQRAS